MPTRSKDLVLLEVSHTANGFAVVSVDAEALDASNSENFKIEIDPLIENGLILVVDLSVVGFIDSSGLGALLSTLRRLADGDGDLWLSGLTKQVRYVLQLARVHKIVRIFNDADEARRAFQA